MLGHSQESLFVRGNNSNTKQPTAFRIPIGDMRPETSISQQNNSRPVDAKQQDNFFENGVIASSLFSEEKERGSDLSTVEQVGETTNNAEWQIKDPSKEQILAMLTDFRPRDSQ